MSENTEKGFLSSFDKPSQEEWRGLIDKQLKGAPFEKKMITKTVEGIDLQPMYWHEDCDALAKEISFPGEFPFTRGATAYKKGWEVDQDFSYPTPAEFNAEVKKDMDRGLTSITMVLDQAAKLGLDPKDSDEVAKGGVSISSVEDLKVALDGVDLSEKAFQVDAGVSGLAFANLMAAYLGDKVADWKGAVINSPLSVLAVEGKLSKSLAQAYDEMAALTKWAIAKTPKLKTITVDARPFCEAGGSAVQELAYAVSMGAQYLQAMVDRGLSVEEAASKIKFVFATGSMFFMEIAKFRAARSVWAQVVKAFGGNEAAQASMDIHAQSSQFNKTYYDTYANMLRTCTESFSGMVGGVDSMSVAAFDDVMGLPDFFGRRIARNQQILLQEEVHGDQVIDPAGGSWYIETLTAQVSEKAWAMFQDVEANGGLLEALKAGKLQGDINDVLNQRLKKVGTRQVRIVGSNMYANVGEELPEARTPDYAAVKAARTEEVAAAIAARGAVEVPAMEELLAAPVAATIGEVAAALKGDAEELAVEPLQIRRLAEDYEELREKAEAFKAEKGDYPKIFMANMGPIPQHKPRAEFTNGFVTPAGFYTLGNDGFATPAEAVKAAVESGADIVALCSTDATYPEIVPAFAKALKAEKPDVMIVLAGYPKDHVESFKADGVDEFIHIKANNLQLLKKLQEKAGVK